MIDIRFLIPAAQFSNISTNLTLLHHTFTFIMSVMLSSNYTALVCPQTPFEPEPTLVVHAVSNSTSISDFVFGLFTFSNLGWFLLLIFLATNAKCLPFIWHIRLTNAFRFTCRSQRPKVEVGPEHLFKPMITVSSAPLMEIDLNMHSKSAFFSVVNHVVDPNFRRNEQLLFLGHRHCENTSPLHLVLQGH